MTNTRNTLSIALVTAALGLGALSTSTPADAYGSNWDHGFGHHNHCDVWGASCNHGGYYWGHGYGWGHPYGYGYSYGYGYPHYHVYSPVVVEPPPVVVKAPQVVVKVPPVVVEAPPVVVEGRP